HPRTHRDPKSSRFSQFWGRLQPNVIFNSILILNGVVFGMWYMSTQRLRHERDITTYKWMADNFICSWSNVKNGQIWTLLTSCFSHQDLSHILFNGFTFFFMAKPVLHILGTSQFLLLYLGSGVVANVISMSYSNLIQNRDKGSIGASGAIYSVVSFLACVAPKLTFHFYGIIPIPAWLAVTGIFAYDVYSTVARKQAGVDTVGHVAGLVSGVGYFLLRRNL
ncbi:hypothetical protein AMATHDRAFT_116088, partial [Amanita thiersii Skay4041]